jgi:hypothetical protein
MADHEVAVKGKNEKSDQKQRVRQQDSWSLLEQFHAWDQEPFPLRVTPFYPLMDEHSTMLSSIPFSAKRHEFLMRLQQTYGNRYVQRLVESVREQAKLTVGASDDPYEREADRVAEQVVNMPGPAENQSGSRQQAIEEEEQSRTQHFLRQQIAEEDKTSVDRLPDISQKQAGDEAPFLVSPDLEERIKQMQGSGAAMPSEERSFFEKRMGYDFGQVRIHTDSNSVQACRDLRAVAFTFGSNIAFNQGAYQPGTGGGRKLLAHELVHVVQQGSAGIRRKKKLGVGLRREENTNVRQRDGSTTLRRDDGPTTVTAKKQGKLKSGPTYNPSGAITPTTSGDRKSASFDFTAEFENDPSNGIYASCCEVRQYIKWRNTTPPNHAGFQPASSYAADTWYEDRDANNKRYGHRSGPYSDPQDFDQYLNAEGNRDQANGAIYRGNDNPRVAKSRTGQWDFKVSVVDTANGDKELGTPSTITINW